MRPVILTLAALAVLGALGAAAVVGLGLYNVSARAGHWPGVSWVLNTTFRNSIRLRAPDAEEVPDLTAPGLAALGQGHYETACAFCHARPGEARPATALSMEPQPPAIKALPGDWEPQHLYLIIQDGIIMSGMPHWPATRKDEVWAVVAYLETLRDEADTGYADTGYTAPEVKSAVAYCVSCHGPQGRTPGGKVPRLDILSQDYIADSLSAYRSGARDSGFMAQAVSLISDAEQAETAAYFAKQPASATTLAPLSPEDASLLAQGEALATRGTVNVPACTACHGPGRSVKPAQMPALNGQWQPYLEQQLHLWRDGRRGGAARAELMEKAAMTLTDQDIAALALYYSRLPVAEATEYDGRGGD
ncbi:MULTISPECIES: c-type cytochrome [unclassified Marinovum]